MEYLWALEHRAQIWLFQPPGFFLDRSAPARTDRGTRASIFKCMTWLNMARDANPGLSVFSALDFGTGPLCRCTQSWLEWTSFSLTLLYSHMEWTGMDGKSSHTFPERKRQAENRMGANVELMTCKTSIKWGSTMNRAEDLRGHVFLTSLKLSPEIQELGTVKKSLAKMALMTFMTSCNEGYIS